MKRQAAIDSGRGPCQNLPTLNSSVHTEIHARRAPEPVPLPPHRSRTYARDFTFSLPLEVTTIKVAAVLAVVVTIGIRFLLMIVNGISNQRAADDTGT